MHDKRGINDRILENVVFTNLSIGLFMQKEYQQFGKLFSHIIKFMWSTV